MTFPLKIVTPDGLLYDGQAERVIVRTTAGDMAVLAKHIDCVAPLGNGAASVIDVSGKRRSGVCTGGILSVMDSTATLITRDFRWTDA